MLKHKYCVFAQRSGQFIASYWGKPQRVLILVARPLTRVGGGRVRGWPLGKISFFEALEKKFPKVMLSSRGGKALMAGPLKKELNFFAVFLNLLLERTARER